NLTSYQSGKFKLRNILPILNALNLTLKMKPTSFFGAKKIMKNFAFHQILSNSTTNGSTFKIYDEGVFHKARSLRRYCRNPDLSSILKYCFQYLDLPDVLIILKADPEVIYERRMERNRENDKF